ncbi:MAG: hypothetical protein K5873_03965 [Treponema sp.]|nr:hypothetical protein [Treponema sp.]
MRKFGGTKVQYVLFDSLNKELLSATDSYDAIFLKKMSVNESRDTPYHYAHHLHKWTNYNDISFDEPTRCTHIPTNCNVFFTPQLMIKDNKGKKGGEAVKPVADNAYDILWRQAGEDLDKVFDYWASVENTIRYVDGVKVDLVKETK